MFTLDSFFFFFSRRKKKKKKKRCLQRFLESFSARIIERPFDKGLPFWEQQLNSDYLHWSCYVADLTFTSLNKSKIKSKMS